MNDLRIPKNISALERRVYEIIRLRAKFVGVSINELCARTGVAPSTFSRWVNGHNSGLIATIGRMDEILTEMEAQKFQSLQQRLSVMGRNLADVCLELDISALDYVRWVKRELDPDYEKLAVFESFLERIEAEHRKASRRRRKP
ncbi:MAG: helix-turn-helix domain-containing protein [Rickettsiales bacterium]